MIIFPFPTIYPYAFRSSSMESYIFLLPSLLLIVFINGVLTIFKKRKLPPGPTGLPILGNLLALGNRPHESLAKLAKKHGPLITVQLRFNTTIVASSEETAREILQKQDQPCHGRSIPHAVTGETGYELSMAWLSGGPRWKKLRKLCSSQLFTTQRLDSLQGLRHQMMDNMVKMVAEASEAREAVSIGSLVFGTTLNLLSNTLFSVDIIDPKSSAIEELKELVWKIMELAGTPNLADYFPILKAFDPQHIRRDIKVSYDGLHALLDEMIEQRLKHRRFGGARCDDFLDILLDYSEEHGAEELSRQEMKVHLTDLLIGGTDTTTTTMEWAMTELLRNPNIMAKAKQELAQTIGIGRSVQEKDIYGLPYLQSILKESMRLHPTAPLLLPRRTETHVEICGYSIPKHTQLYVNTWAIARDAAYWEEPLRFIPERFMGSDIDFRGNNFSFLPFGAGRRICPGLPLALRMMNVLLASLIHHFDWELPDGMGPEDIDMKDKFGITMQKAIPLVAIPVRVAGS